MMVIVDGQAVRMPTLAGVKYIDDIHSPELRTIAQMDGGRWVLGWVGIGWRWPLGYPRLPEAHLDLVTHQRVSYCLSRVPCVCRFEIFAASTSNVTFALDIGIGGLIGYTAFGVYIAKLNQVRISFSAHSGPALMLCSTQTQLG